MTSPHSGSRSPGLVVLEQTCAPVTTKDSPPRPSWRTTMLSPSPSPQDGATEAVLAEPMLVSGTAVDVSPNSQSPVRDVTPLRTVRQTSTAYRSPPPLPRLEINHAIRQSIDSPEEQSFTLQSPPPPKSRLPAVYQAQSHSTKDYYPTPNSSGERVRWPAPSPYDERPGGFQAGHRPRSTGNTPDGSGPHMGGPPDAYAPPPTMTRPQAGYVHGHPQSTYGMMRPRLSIHPYAPPAMGTENRYWSAGGIPPHMGGAMGLHERSFCSPASAISSNSFKAPRKRADDLQLNVLNEVFERTSYPSTEEREDLARRLGMTSRSVQIWFQNRRRAVKVEQQSAIQRAEADAISRRGAPPYLSDPYLGGVSMGPSPASSIGSGQHGMPMGPLREYPRLAYGVHPEEGYSVVKREMTSPERDHRF